jgi:hypothetical protein
MMLMALFVNRDQKRSQYQEKIAADLKGKLQTQDIKAKEVESTMLEDAHQTRPAGLIIAALLLIIFIVAIVVMFRLG